MAPPDPAPTPRTPRPVRDPIREAHRQWVAHGWSDAADAMALVTSVTRAQQLLAERVERALRPHGLTFARFEVLRLLSFTRDRALPMTRLGSLLQVHPASVTSAVDRLEAQGFVRRERRSEDRRVVHAELTDAGTATVEQATADLNTVFTDLAADLGPGTVTELTRLLGALRTGAGDQVDGS